jgi:hypothetical protein
VDFGGLVLLALLWIFLKMVTRGREENANAPRRPVPRPPGGPSAGPDATQREGSQLERLLRQLERAMEQGGAGPMGRRPAPGQLPPAEEVEERETLEVSPPVESLETEVRRPGRAAVDQDEEAERVIARRAAAAAARSGRITRADREAFDRRIRQEPADHTAVRALTPQQLRDAVVWREILGPPVSERER